MIEHILSCVKFKNVLRMCQNKWTIFSLMDVKQIFLTIYFGSSYTYPLDFLYPVIDLYLIFGV